MTDRESAPVQGAETPAPTWDGAGEGWGGPSPPLCHRHPVESRQRRGARDVVGSGTGALLSHRAAAEDATRPAGGTEDGGSVVAACQRVRRWIGCRSARRGRHKGQTVPVAAGGIDEGLALAATGAPSGKGLVESSSFAISLASRMRCKPPVRFGPGERP
jgi:hypothetical protein